MLPSMVPRLATDSLVRVLPGVWKVLSFLRLPSQAESPSLPLLSLFLSFIFFPVSFWRQWAAFLGAWCPLPAFRSCLWNVLSVQIFFWWICGGESGLPVLFLCHLRTTPLFSLVICVTFNNLSSHLHSCSNVQIALPKTLPQTPLSDDDKLGPQRVLGKN